MIPSYKIYILEEAGIPRTHKGIFLETSPSLPPFLHSNGTGGGHYFNVEGTVLTGMTYITKPIPSSLSALPTFEKMTLIGTLTLIPPSGYTGTDPAEAEIA